MTAPVGTDRVTYHIAAGVPGMSLDIVMKLVCELPSGGFEGDDDREGVDAAYQVAAEAIITHLQERFAPAQVNYLAHRTYAHNPDEMHDETWGNVS